MAGAIYTIIRWNRRIRSRRLKTLAVVACRRMNIRHLSVRFDPVVACNLRCLMCPFTAARARTTPTGAFTPAEVTRLADMLFPRTRQLVVGCSYEPTLYGDFVEVIRQGKRHGVPHVGLVTNGQRLDRELIGGVVDAGADEITLSAHGVRPGSYEALMPGASHARFLETLSTIADVRRSGGASGLSLRLNFTVCRQNLEEIPTILDVYGPFGIDVLQVRPMFGGGYEQGRLRECELFRYSALLGDLATACRARGIVLMANRDDPLYRRMRGDALVLHAAYLYVDPLVVWREDFDWRRETYDEYCRRSGLERRLLRNLLQRRGADPLLDGRYADVARYDV